MGVSRKPAAIAGIVLVLVVGYGFVQGIDQLTGQLQNPAAATPAAVSSTAAVAAPAVLPKTIVIRITEQGPVPVAAKVAGGGMVTIINDREFPQIIRSKDPAKPILDSKGTPILSPALFKDDRYQFTVSQTQQAGTYAFTSDTTPELLGTLTIGPSAGGPAQVPAKPAASKPAFTNPPSTTPFGTLDGINLPSGLGTDYVAPSDTTFASPGVVPPAAQPTTIISSAATQPVPASSIPPEQSSSSAQVSSATPERSSASPVAAEAADDAPVEFALPEEKHAAATDNANDNEAQIPVNPYAIGSNKHHPFDDQGSALHAGAPRKPGKRPAVNTKTGPALWITVLMSIAALLWVTRRQLKGWR